MPISAKLKYLRISPRKVRLVANLIRGMDAEEAKTQLKFLPKRAAGPILKLLNSAVANAEHDFNLSKENLYISKITVDAGPSLKRWMPRAMGRATPIMKRTSHVTIVLEERVKSHKMPKAVQQDKATKKEKLTEKKAEQEKQKEQKETEKPVIKAPKKTLREVKGVEKPIPQPGFKNLAKRVFRRKSI
jgi:large subunit ribosomal protein L22